jgi:hypothetical protein
MKYFILLSLFLLASLTALHAQEAKKETFTPAADKAGVWAFTPDPKLPNVLILGDSISIGYTRDVRKELSGKANVFRPMNAKETGPDNCGDTEMGVAGIEKWLGDRKWNVIHFNWGLWDLCYRTPGKAKGGNRDKVNGKISITTEAYEANLEKLVKRLQTTGAKLIWAHTSNVPEGESGRVAGDEVRYNAVALKVMQQHNIPVDDLYTLTHEWNGKYSVKSGDVHYTTEGSKLLGAQVAKAILPLLK